MQVMRFDCAEIAVADLERAVGAYRFPGFDVFPGGREEHRGTHNALIRFGGGQYLKLLSVYDPDEAVRSGPNGRAIAEKPGPTWSAPSRCGGRDRTDAHLTTTGAGGRPLAQEMAFLYPVELPDGGAPRRRGGLRASQRGERGDGPSPSSSSARSR